MSDVPMIEWEENGERHRVRWRSQGGVPPAARVVVADDTLSADAAYRLACEGTALLWRADFHNGRQLLQAMARRAERNARKTSKDPAEAFHLHRQVQAQRARTLGMLLIPFEAGHHIRLRRAPDVREACTQVYGEADAPYVASLRELQGLIGAFEWRKKGVEIPALSGRIHPYYGVFSPVRGEYVELVAKAPIPAGTRVAFDIGTGTGVLAAMLAKRGLAQVVASEQDARALACAADNLARLGVADRVELAHVDLFPQGQADLVVCNPPWVPARPSSAIEHAVYDPDSRMLRGFLAGLAAHLTPQGEGWLILSDFAEHLGLRTREQLLAWIEAGGLEVRDRLDIRPRHPKTMDENDPLHAARRAEVTSLWRLGARQV
jgi:methylase of polypeptide subunit release factors